MRRAAHAGGQVLDLQARQPLRAGSDGMPGRQRLRGRAGEGVMARIYREMPLNSIWEGAGNIMALDLLRALRGADVLPALEHELAPARGAHAALDRAAARGAATPSTQGVHEAQARTPGARHGAGAAGRAAAAAGAGLLVFDDLLRLAPGGHARRLRPAAGGPDPTLRGAGRARRCPPTPTDAGDSTHEAICRAAPPSSPAPPRASASRPAASPRGWA